VLSDLLSGSHTVNSDPKSVILEDPQDPEDEDGRSGINRGVQFVLPEDQETISGNPSTSALSSISCSPINGNRIFYFFATLAASSVRSIDGCPKVFLLSEGWTMLAVACLQ
jgi:hypothetical protein